MQLPPARVEALVVQNLHDETLAYDMVTHQTFCLNGTASVVYRACDARSSFAELKRKHGLTDETIFLALDELKRANLLEHDNTYVSPFAGMSRRAVIRRVGLASMAALPIIESLVAPSAAAAQSGQANYTRCTSAAQCQSGNCVRTSYLPVGTFCCPAGSTGGTQPGPIGTAIGPECFTSCSQVASALCCSGSARSIPCVGDGGFCASIQQFCCACN